MAQPRRASRHAQQVDIWPGFVDALTTLVSVIIFLLVVFVLGQFFLNQLLQGKDSKLLSLEAVITELTEQLDLEQASNAELQLSVARLSADLEAANAARDDNNALVAELEAERDEFRDRLITLEDERNLLAQTLAELRQNATDSGQLQAELERANQLRAELEAELERARQTVQTGQQTLEARLAELVQLRRDIEALRRTRGTLEKDVAEMAALLKAAEDAKADAADELGRLTAQLAAAREEAATLEQRATGAEQRSATLEERIAELNALLAESQKSEQEKAAEIATLSSQLEAEQQSQQQATTELDERERRIAELAAQLEATRQQEQAARTDLDELEKARTAILAQLAQQRDRAAALEDRLANEQERTTLSQRELEERAIRITELLRSVSQANAAAETEQKLSRQALDQVDTLNRQINALRVQLAALEQALDLERQRVDDQKVTIADLGSKLNVALAGKVEELSRFRSEFFGRLRQILGTRPGIQIVGDRFVFQSEILFPTASAILEPGGQDELRALAQSLREISAEIPSELPWVLQIDGHTDRRPINTPLFPSNWELSTARAATVGKFLVSQGIPPERIAVAGFAQFQPIDQRNDEIAYRRNRRIEIKLTTR